MEEAENPQKSKQNKKCKIMKKIFKISNFQELISSSDEDLNKRSGETYNESSYMYVCAENESDALLQCIADFLTEVDPLRIEERTTTSVTITRSKKIGSSVFGERKTCEITIKATFVVECEI